METGREANERSIEKWIEKYMESKSGGVTQRDRHGLRQTRSQIWMQGRKEEGR